MATRLDDGALRSALQNLPLWRHEAAEGRITRVFQFGTFSEAFGFMARCALAAEKAGHHPDWSNSYNTVTVFLSTHDAGGITDKDIALARAFDALA